MEEHAADHAEFAIVRLGDGKIEDLLKVLSLERRVIFIYAQRGPSTNAYTWLFEFLFENFLF